MCLSKACSGDCGDRDASLMNYDTHTSEAHPLIGFVVHNGAKNSPSMINDSSSSCSTDSLPSVVYYNFVNYGETGGFTVDLHDIPGGSNDFELCAKFCYGIKIDLSAHYIVPAISALKNDPQVCWSYTYTRQGYAHRKHHKSAPKDWWTKDIADLNIDLFRCVINTLRSTNMLPPQLIGEALHVYAYRWLPDVTKCRTDRETSTASQMTQEECLGDGKGSGYNSIIPDAPCADLHSLTKDFAKKIGDN
ncbi:BTB/POZ domain-containing protein isoform X1 [Tanacetum coccineum]